MFFSRRWAFVALRSPTHTIEFTLDRMSPSSTIGDDTEATVEFHANGQEDHGTARLYYASVKRPKTT